MDNSILIVAKSNMTILKSQYNKAQIAVTNATKRKIPVNILKASTEVEILMIKLISALEESWILLSQTINC